MDCLACPMALPKMGVRMLASTHYTIMEPLLESFKEGYRTTMGPEAEEVFRRADEIRRRGRYIDKE